MPIPQKKVAGTFGQEGLLRKKGEKEWGWGRGLPARFHAPFRLKGLQPMRIVQRWGSRNNCNVTKVDANAHALTLHEIWLCSSFVAFNTMAARSAPIVTEILIAYYIREE
jgi:hypothetical protein